MLRSPAAQGNLAIAQGKQAEFDFEQDCQRTPAAIAAELKEADLAHHAERLILQRLQDSQFLGRATAEHKSHSFLELFPVRYFTSFLHGSPPLLFSRCSSDPFARSVTDEGLQQESSQADFAALCNV